MKKIIRIIVSFCLLITVSGCQTSRETTDSDEYVKQFIHHFLSVTYEENDSPFIIQEKLGEEIKSYFNEMGYAEFTKYNYITIPTEIADHYQSDISVKDIRLEETFNEEGSIGYIADVTLKSSSDVIELKLRIRIKSEKNNWKISGIRFINMD